MKKRILAFILATLMSFTLVSFANPKEKENPQPSPRPIIIQGAMDVETENLVAQLQNVEKITYGGWLFFKGTVDNYPVVVTKTEIGMTNAAASTLLAIEKFNPLAIINQGTSGGHDPALHRYDIVIGKKSVNFGSFRSEHSDYNKGIHAENWIPMDINVSVNGEIKELKDFEGNTTLIETAKSVMNTYKKGKVVEGVIGSADQWNRELDRIKWIHEKYATSVEEMETASAAQIAKTYKVPFLGIRILSNSEIHDEGYDRNSGEYCQDFVLKVTKKLIQQARQNKDFLQYKDESTNNTTIQ
ncbi:5'-methylthioadenosine/S-adenosylhomocysteine nucleosidase [Crassaminicella profunda]|uniref:5'-methylthioadenosine/S-adenosylhomocysteine nucleosidase n=1 Tax=Crassaminicella profunda TaxID=1286698 RepID=UPI001CA7499B|nr:5'-methylthioadenosine/S-adenosylhomocysteine nucleosidase [Crassaminicella profunda]QZY55855.1 5'-methylthioadenosine/S-adenosylhomocysteine nucleosidase [Crassaminicella profunda]